MHVPDGFLDAPTSVGTAVVAAGVVAACLARSARHELTDRSAPLAGLVAVFVFAAQMVTFPVGAGTSGHLLGGVLAAVLVGPATATLCLTVVVTVQAFLFADGGVSALGTNVLLMAVVAVWVGYGVFRVALAVLPRRLSSVSVAAGVGALVSVPMAALAFVGLYALGGAAPDPAGPAGRRHDRLARRHRRRRGRHHRARRVERRGRATRPRVRRPRSPAGAGAAHPGAGRVSTRRLVVIGLVVSALVAGVLSFYASGHPDGLTYVARVPRLRRHRAQTRATSGSPLAGYAVSGVGDARLSGGLAGLVGLAVVGLVMTGLVLLLRRRSPRGED